MTTRRDQHELLHLAEIFRAAAHILGNDKRGAFEICELGCTTGWLSQELLALGRVTGVDPDKERIAAARASYPGVTFEVADFATWSPPHAFDFTVSCEVLEHLTDKRAYVDALKRITKPGGWILVTTPNQKLKSYWDAADMGEGLYEGWLTTRQLRALFADSDIVEHSTFLYDFAYTGVYRLLNARKLIAVLNSLGLAPFNVALRHALGLGLYQLLLCRRR